MNLISMRRPSLTSLLSSMMVATLFLFPLTSVYATNSMIKLSTNKGDIVLELYSDKAPNTVANFKQYVSDGFFDGLIFHRVISGFMIQGGGFTPDMKQKETGDPIENEADNGLKNVTGTVAMARTGDPHSATAQFFINLEDNGFLDHTGKNPQGWGYAVFGKVTEGLDVVKEIGQVSTGRSGPYSDVPVDPVVIESASVVE